MSWISVFLLAVVEGLTEFLPVSSTGHMIIASSLMQIPQTEFLSNFEIIIQVGAILAILSKYWQTLWKRKDYWPKIVAAFIPTSILGFLGYRLVKTVFLGNVAITMLGLLGGGILIVVIEQFVRSSQSLDTLTIKKAGFIGLWQAMAIIPGVSRSAATIIAGKLTGLSRSAAVEFSFLLGLPVLVAASGFDIVKAQLAFTALEWSQLMVGLLVAFAVARLSVDWLLRFVKTHSLSVFGWYRIGLALLYFTSLWVLGR